MPGEIFEGTQPLNPVRPVDEGPIRPDQRNSSEPVLQPRSGTSRYPLPDQKFNLTPRTGVNTDPSQTPESPKSWWDRIRQRVRK